MTLPPYPLAWPETLPRTERKASSAFRTSLAAFGHDTSKPVSEIAVTSNAAGVPYFRKQWGDWVALEQDSGFWPTDSKSCCRLDASGNRTDTGHPMQRVGKARAGHLLNGVAHQELPR